MRASTPDLSVIIVSWNTRELLAACLRSVLGRSDEQTACQAGDVETFVIDNASDDGSVEMVQRRFPWARLIENRENVGFARANNQGIVQARGRYVLLLNPDTEVWRGSLDALAEFMDAHPRAGACGARLLNSDGTLQASAHPMLTPGREFWRLLFLDRLWPRATYPMDRWSTSTPQRVEVLQGACLLVRREALDQTGMLDDSYFMYTEEVDLCYRLARAGWQLWYVPEATVTHYGAASSRQVKETMYLQLYRSKIQFYRKFGGERRARLAKTLLALAYVPRVAATAIVARVRPAWRPRAHLYRQLLAELAVM